MNNEILGELGLNSEVDCFDVWVCGFEYFADLTEKEASKLTIIDLLKNGYAQKYDINSFSGRANKFEKFLLDNKFEGLNFFIKIFSSILHRKECVLFLRESLDFINFDEFEQDKRWIEIKDKIISTDPKVGEADKELIDSVGARSFLADICNYITHGMMNRGLQGKEEPATIRSVKWYKKVNAKVFIDGYDSATQIKVWYTPDKGLHRYSFLIGQKELRDIDFLILEHLEGLPEADPEECNRYSSGRGEKQIHINYGNITETCLLDNHQVQALATRQKNNLNLKHLFYVDNKNDCKDDTFANNVVGVVDTVDCSISYYKQFLMSRSTLAVYILIAFAFSSQCSELEKRELDSSKSAIRKLLEIKQADAIKHLTVNYAKDTILETFWRMFPNNLYNTFTEAVCILTGHRALEPKRMYIELLLTELLELLELIDSYQGKEKVYWQQLVDTYAVFDEIAKQRGAIDGRGQIAILHTLRNALVHIKYVIDDDRLYFYDGKDKNEFKFELSIEELEELKQCAIEFINDKIDNNSFNV